MLDGENPYEAAVSGALLNGRVAQATEFASAVSSSAGAAANTAIHNALTSVAAGTDADVAGSALSESNLAAMATTTSGAGPATTSATTSVPAQAKNGDTAAMGYYSWLLKGIEKNHLYYGYCQATCVTLGYFWVTMSANTFFNTSNGLLWSDSA